MAPAMTVERLGLDPNGHAAVWVCWIDEPVLLDALEQLPVGFECPECGSAIDLARPRGVLACAGETPNCRSVSDRCGQCQARLHFDNTPAADRPALRWPAVAIGARPLERPAHLAPALADAIETTLRRSS